MLTLRKAIADNRLEEFIKQQEADGVGRADERELLDAIEVTIKPPRSKDRTSRSASRDDSTGK